MNSTTLYRALTDLAHHTPDWLRTPRTSPPQGLTTPGPHRPRG
ncbi:hypothetical protein [Streptomyces platensis]|nr:hypothetical protein [Streptomyces platensis]WUB80582.1 hypothetical protein OG424_16155 [Streptomyces platensis]